MITALFAAMGVYAMGVGGVHLWRYRKSRNWPAVSGVVYEQLVGTAPRTVTGDIPQTVMGSVQYEYEVDGFRLSGSFGVFQLLPSSPWGAWKLLRDYPVGSKLLIRYDPAKPGRHFVDRGIEDRATLYTATGLAMLTIAVVFWFAGTGNQ